MAYTKGFQDTVLDRFVQLAKADRHRVEIITRNGYHMYGYIVDGDDRALLLEVENSTRLVMLAAVSTIIPREKKPGSDDVE